jgi:drug/metabolite transporter (DMT)-like permease
MWIYLGLLSALFLAFYHLSKKHAVSDNAVLMVLWLSTLAGLVGLFPLWILSTFSPQLLKDTPFLINPISIGQSLLIAVKSLIITLSWTLSFFALKNLPITLVSPIRAAGPVFTLIGAILLYQESPSPLQWTGFFCIIASVFLYSALGKQEGIHFKSNPWILAIIVATLLGAVSGLYDKFLIQNRSLSAITVQFWFTFYNCLFTGIGVGLFWWPQRKLHTRFQFKITIILIGVLLLLADFFYFTALEDPDALISILSALKRSQVVFTVILGGLFFKEKNKRKKLIPLTGILIGVGLILYSV